MHPAYIRQPNVLAQSLIVLKLTSASTTSTGSSLLNNAFTFPMVLISPFSSKMSPCTTCRPSCRPVQIEAFRMSTGVIPGSYLSYCVRSLNPGGEAGFADKNRHFASVLAACNGTRTGGQERPTKSVVKKRAVSANTASTGQTRLPHVNVPPALDTSTVELGV